MKWRGGGGGGNINVVLGFVFFPVFPLGLMFLCAILWSGCCLRGSRSCCRLRWATIGGRGCVVGSWLLLLLFFRKCALVCVLWRKGRLSADIIYPLSRKSPTHLSGFKLHSKNSAKDNGVPKCLLKKATPLSWPAALCSWFISGCFNLPVVYSRLLSWRFPH